MPSFSVKIVLQAVDKAITPIKRLEQSLAGLQKVTAINNLGRSLDRATGSVGNMTRETGLLAARFAGLAGLGAVAFKGLFLDTAMEFERFQTILETIEGSADGARKSMRWVEDFATRTPYELNEVTESFVKLRAYGLDPTQGLLRSLGDTASAMGKPLMQAVEAIADAVTGENERLKEFGIKAKAVGDKFVYEYTENGKTMTKSAEKSNRAMIQSTLEAIFNAKYAGAMAKQSKTFNGLLSNLQDYWTRFSNMVMGAGVFDFLKGELEGILAKVDKMSESGELATRAQKFAQELIPVLKDVWQLVAGIGSGLVDLARFTNQAAKAVGGYNNLLKILVGLMAAPLVVSIVQSAIAIGGFIGAIWGAVTSATALSAIGWVLLDIFLFLTSPIGLVVAGITALAGVAFLVYQNWGKISNWFVAMWQEWGGVIRKIFPLVGFFVDLAEVIITNWEPLMAWFAGLFDSLKTGFDEVANWVLDKWKPVGDFFVRLGETIENIGGKAMNAVKASSPNVNMLTGKKSMLGVDRPTVSLGPATNVGASVPVAIQPKKDVLEVAMKVDFAGRPSITGVNSKGDSDLSFYADMGMINA